MKASRISARCWGAAAGTTLLAVVVGALTPGLSTEADADNDYNIVFRIKSRYDYAIQVAFYSQNRNVSWPSHNRGYVIDNSRVHEFNLRCRPSEQICYGGWVENRTHHYWGVGLNNKQTCHGCCYRCDDNATRLIVLE
jgi:hypothetical protein